MVNSPCNLLRSYKVTGYVDSLLDLLCETFVRRCETVTAGVRKSIGRANIENLKFDHEDEFHRPSAFTASAEMPLVRMH